MDDLALDQLEADPEIMAKRIAAIDKALKAYDGGSDEEAVTDFLADLMHWCDATAVTFDDCLESARMHHGCELPDESPVCMHCGEPVHHSGIEYDNDWIHTNAGSIPLFGCDGFVSGEVADVAP